jgi:hypothetical protein
MTHFSTRQSSARSKVMALPWQPVSVRPRIVIFFAPVFTLKKPSSVGRRTSHSAIGFVGQK